MTIYNSFNRFKIKYWPKFSKSGLIGLFFISPLLSLPYIIFNSYKKDKISQLLLCIFIGLLSICFVPPRADLYRIYNAFLEIKGYTLDQTIDNLRFDFVLPFLQYFFSHIGFDFEIIRMIFISSSYLCFTSIYNYLTNIYKPSAILFLYCLLSPPFMELSLGIRYGCAVTFICYVIIKKFVISKKLSWTDYFILIISPCIHFGTIWLVILPIICDILPKNLNKLIIIGIFFFAYILSSYFNELIGLLAFDNETEQLVSHYGAEGAYGTKFITHNLIGSIPEYYSYFMVYSTILIFVFFIPCKGDTLIPWIVILVWAFSHNLYGISARVDSIILVLTPIYIFKYYKYRSLFLKLIALGCVLVAVINWRAYTVSHSALLLLSPIFVLTIGYDQAWFDKFVDKTGTLYIYKR